MLDPLNVLTFIWLALWALFALSRIFSGHLHSISFPILAHFVLSGLPLLFDLLFGQPEYLRQPGFYVASRDETTAIIYCLYVSAVPPFWWLVGRSSRPELSSISFEAGSFQIARRLRLPVFILLISPLIAWLFAPKPEIYFQYAWFIVDYRARVDLLEYHGIVSLLTLLSVVAAVALVAAARKRLLGALLFAAPWVFLAFWLNGKRYIVAFAVVMFLYVFWRRGVKGVKFAAIGLVCGAAVILFSDSYQNTVREMGFLSDAPDAAYENFRIDYGRDDVIKMTIYAELYPEKMRILEHRGQSILFYLTMYVPRALWPEKPLPYAQYFTSAMLMVEPQMLGWGMTTSWLEEAIANFGWVGLLLGPLLPALICRVGDSTSSAEIGTLSAFISSLFLAVHLSAFAPLFILWLLLVAAHKSRRVRLRGARYPAAGVHP